MSMMNSYPIYREQADSLASTDCQCSDMIKRTHDLCSRPWKFILFEEAELGDLAWHTCILQHNRLTHIVCSFGCVESSRSKEKYHT